MVPPMSLSTRRALFQRRPAPGGGPAPSGAPPLRLQDVPGPPSQTQKFGVKEGGLGPCFLGGGSATAAPGRLGSRRKPAVADRIVAVRAAGGQGGRFACVINPLRVGAPQQTHPPSFPTLDLQRGFMGLSGSLFSLPRAVLHRLLHHVRQGRIPPSPTLSQGDSSRGSPRKMRPATSHSAAAQR